VGWGEITKTVSHVFLLILLSVGVFLCREPPESEHTLGHALDPGPPGAAAFPDLQGGLYPAPLGGRATTPALCHSWTGTLQ
jgi:hypothetical protein